MDKISFITEIIKRFQASSPEFFKKMQKYSWALFAIFGATWLLDELKIYTVPESVDSLLLVLIGVFFGSAGTAATAVKEEAKAKAGIPADEPANDLVGGRPNDRK